MKENELKHQKELAKDLAPIMSSYGQYWRTELLASDLIKLGYRKQSEWISVEEKLPTGGGLVLVSSMDLLTKKHGWFYLASYDNKRKWWNGASFGRVTHWMPLPELPKTKGGE